MAAILSLKEDLDQRHGENLTAQAVTDAKVVEAIRGIDELCKAFPDGDPDGHRRYHEAIIKKNEACEKFYQELTSHLVKGGAWALIVFLAWASWQAIKAKVTQ
ncbi:hypothetical protein P0D69_15420 [Paraburkholderia sediminicola]|uniref:hypothetical protein n=1 Tax=Paraburkholderia sediminicola TaxID=458836 RepID=UPI0038B84FD9